MSDIPMNQFFQPTKDAARRSALTTIPADLLARVPTFYTKIANLIWADLSEQERARFVGDLTRLAELSAESTPDEQILRDQQKQKNEKAIQALQALRAEEAELSPEDNTLLAAEWQHLEHLLTTERV